MQMDTTELFHFETTLKICSALKDCKPKALVHSVKLGTFLWHTVDITAANFTHSIVGIPYTAATKQ